ncbi:MAG: Ig-like domain-containing protein, partial [Bacilli bacterium]|nr:Ig-like domain-containing protein [Bacilli bacterium]
MNKLFKKIAGVALGFSLAIGAGIGSKYLGNGFAETKAANPTVDFTLSSASDVSKNGVNVSFAKASGSNAPAWNTAGLRLYAKNTVTISCVNGITGVSFNWEKQGSKPFASATAGVGTYTHPASAGVGTWTGSAKTVVFTLGGSGQLQLNTFSVEYVEGTLTYATGVSLTGNASMYVGTTQTLTATVSPENATSKLVSYSSSNPDIIAVDDAGVVSAISTGKATIT